MKSTGITRPCDSLGRVVLPKELRDEMDIKPDDRLEILVGEISGVPSIILQPFIPFNKEDFISAMARHASRLCYKDKKDVLEMFPELSRYINKKAALDSAKSKNGA
jgi:AbrB family looped-hinge helix DNA binding protein